MNIVGRTPAPGSPRRCKISAQPLMRSMFAGFSDRPNFAYCPATLVPSLALRTRRHPPRTVSNLKSPICDFRFDAPDRLNVPLRKPKPLRVLIHNERVAVSIRAAEQNDSVVREAVIERREPLPRAALIKILNRVDLAPERCKELSAAMSQSPLLELSGMYAVETTNGHQFTPMKRSFQSWHTT